MKVLIVAKTRQGGRACVGGITSEGQSVRLRAADYDADESAGMEYEVGEVWEIDSAPAPSVVAPHVENVVVNGARKLGLARDLVGSIERHMPPVCGGPELLYDGLVQVRESGSLFISGAGGVPSRSTMFWRPDRALERDDSGKRIRYRYTSPAGLRSLVYVGFQDPVETIPAGTLTRVSLAHWWRPEDRDEEPRCYVQLSGWFGLNGCATPPACPVQMLAPPPCDDRARTLLKSVFGYDAFRPLQHEIVANLLAGRDTLAVMPTGSGKSLCYQLPALIFDGLTVVVSPLISLMQDQVDQLRKLGIAAAFLNSTLDYRAASTTMSKVRSGEIKLLYTSPETLLRPETLVMLDHSHVSCLAIDEAHCISQWGHDFRPDYRQLLAARRRYPGAVCVAFTATATAQVRDDIAQQLGMRDENRFVASFDRPNLHLRAQRRDGNGLDQLRSFLQGHPGESGIIYCTSRAGVDQVAAMLAAGGWSVLAYHAGLDDATRRWNQEQFSQDRVPLMVATIAFGMGINKPNVRFVVHLNLPMSVEHYYQEIGRAGRDGLPAHCLLLHRRSDIHVLKRFIADGAPEERAPAQARLSAMLRYAETRRCRRHQLLEYFGERSAAPACRGCDNCVPVEEPVSIVHGPSKAGARVRVAPSQPDESAVMPVDPQLLEKLRALRSELAQAQGVMSFTVFPDRTLSEIAAKRPQSDAALLGIYGIGPYKLRKYGARVLQLVREHAGAAGDGAAQPREGHEDAPPGTPLRGRTLQVGQLFAAGCSVDDIATVFRISYYRVLHHLSNCAMAGMRFPLERVAPLCRLEGEQRARALQRMEELTPYTLSHIYVSLDGAVSYEELNALRLCYWCGEAAR